jgi:hypothetical protein
VLTLRKQRDVLLLLLAPSPLLVCGTKLARYM